MISERGKGLDGGRTHVTNGGPFSRPMHTLLPAHCAHVRIGPPSSFMAEKLYLVDGHAHLYRAFYGVRGLATQEGRPSNAVFGFTAMLRKLIRDHRPEFLAGWMGEVYSVEREEALDMCKQEFSSREQNNIAAHMPGDKHSSLHVETKFSRINSDLILLPIFLLSYKHGDKLYRFMINGQTGRMAGDKPVSHWRIGMAVGLGLFILLLFLIFVMLL